MTPTIAAFATSAASAMRHWRVLLPLAVAAVSAGFAWIAAAEYLRSAESRIARQYAERHLSREFVVAARRLEPGARLEAGLLALRTVPVRYAPKSAVGPERLGDLLGRELTQPLDAGDILVPGALRDPVAPALATRLAAGERALTITVDDRNSHAGLLRPGDLVDLLFLSVDDSGMTQSAQIRPLLQAVRVLATGRAMHRPVAVSSVEDGPAQDFATLTLQVAARDAERIALAERAGELLVSLRAPGDLDPTHHGPLRLDALLADGPAASGTRRTRDGWRVDGWIGGRDGRWMPYRWRVAAAGGGGSP